MALVKHATKIAKSTPLPQVLPKATTHLGNNHQVGSISSPSTCKHPHVMQESSSAVRDGDDSISLPREEINETQIGARKVQCILIQFSLSIYNPETKTLCCRMNDHSFSKYHFLLSHVSVSSMPTIATWQRIRLRARDGAPVQSAYRPGFPCCLPRVLLPMVLLHLGSACTRVV